MQLTFFKVESTNWRQRGRFYPFFKENIFQPNISREKFKHFTRTPDALLLDMEGLFFGVEKAKEW